MEIMRWYYWGRSNNHSKWISMRDTFIRITKITWNCKMLSSGNSNFHSHVLWYYNKCRSLENVWRKLKERGRALTKLHSLSLTSSIFIHAIFLFFCVVALRVLCVFHHQREECYRRCTFQQKENKYFTVLRQRSYRLEPKIKVVSR